MGTDDSTMRTTTVYGEYARELVTELGLYVRAQQYRDALEPQLVQTVGRAGHGGSSAHAIDIDADMFMREALRQREPDAIYKSEESDSGMNLVPSTIIFHAD